MTSSVNGGLPENERRLVTQNGGRCASCLHGFEDELSEPSQSGRARSGKGGFDILIKVKRIDGRITCEKITHTRGKRGRNCTKRRNRRPEKRRRRGSGGHGVRALKSRTTRGREGGQKTTARQAAPLPSHNIPGRRRAKRRARHGSACRRTCRWSPGGKRPQTRVTHRYGGRGKGIERVLGGEVYDFDHLARAGRSI